MDENKTLVPLDEVLDEIRQMLMASNIRDKDRPDGHGSILIRGLELYGRLQWRFRNRMHDKEEVENCFTERETLAKLRDIDNY